VIPQCAEEPFGTIPFVPTYLDFSFSDGTSVVLQAFETGEPDQGGSDGEPGAAMLPQGLAGGRPVSSGGRRAQVTKLAQDSLRAALSPLAPLLQQVHETVAQVPDPPSEVSVEFGVRFGADLKLGIVGGNGESSMKISATWQLPPGPANPAE
jgi:hypothetical protein